MQVPVGMCVKGVIERELIAGDNKSISIDFPFLTGVLEGRAVQVLMKMCV